MLYSDAMRFKAEGFREEGGRKSGHGKNAYPTRIWQREGVWETRQLQGELCPEKRFWLC